MSVSGCVVVLVYYLGLESALQRAEGSRRRDDRGEARHGWWVGVEELQKERKRKMSVRLVCQR